jgi:transcriptional regulator with XRE-family HTH domain
MCYNFVDFMALMNSGGSSMIEQVEPNVGLRIKEIRMAKGLALRKLGELCDLSANAISLIERGENSPTVSSLHKLSVALKVPITDFFVRADKLSAVHVKKGQGMKFSNGGLALESLGIGLPNQQLEPFQLTVDPQSGITNDPIVHSGQEFVYCLEGRIEYYVEDQMYLLSPGDSLLLEATRPHSWKNNTQQLAIVLLVFQATSESHLARQKHLKWETNL